jgi:3-hydroxyisobutyrate dehydrogenase-like beta-hydroxyacid dehydrogenase
MARRIAGAGFPLTIWARRRASVDALADVSPTVADSPRRLAACSDLVGICVRADADVEAVVHGPDGVLAGARPGTIVAIHATVHPDTCIRLAEEAAGRGVVVIDAPVSGARIGAQRGELLVMTGGDRPAAERCRPVFAAFGDLVVHMGPIGTAQRAKLVNNALLTANIALSLDALELGAALEIDPDMLARSMQHGSGGSYGLGVLIGMRDEPEVPKAGRALLRKDVDLLAATARQFDADPGALVEQADRFLERSPE